MGRIATFCSLSQPLWYELAFSRTYRELFKHVHIDGLSNSNWLSATPACAPGLTAGWLAQGKSRLRTCLWPCKCTCYFNPCKWTCFYQKVHHVLFCSVVSIPFISLWINPCQTCQRWIWNGLIWTNRLGHDIDLLPIFFVYNSGVQRYFQMEILFLRVHMVALLM